MRKLILLFVMLFSLSVPALSAAVEVGSPAPPFTLKTPAGESVSLADFKGKVVLLKVATTWCPSCADLNRELAALGGLLKSGEVVLLEVFIQDSAEMVERDQAGRTFPMTHHALLDDRQIYKGYGIYTIPRLLVIGRDQTVRYDNGHAATILPAAEMKKIVERALSS